MPTVSTIKMDLKKETCIPIIDAVQNDTDRNIDVILEESFDGYSARFYAVKPSGTEIYNECDINNNIITVKLTSQTLAEPGITDCQIQLYLNEKKVTTFLFKVNVSKSLVNESAIESQDEFSVLETAVANANIAVMEAKEAINTAAVIADGKVDKVVGKSLSTNDFTNSYMSKVQKIKDNLSDTVFLSGDGTYKEAQSGGIKGVKIVTIGVENGSGYTRSDVDFYLQSNDNFMYFIYESISSNTHIIMLNGTYRYEGLYNQAIPTDLSFLGILGSGGQPVIIKPIYTDDTFLIPEKHSNYMFKNITIKSSTVVNTGGSGTLNGEGEIEFNDMVFEDCTIYRNTLLRNSKNWNIIVKNSKFINRGGVSDHIIYCEAGKKFILENNTFEDAIDNHAKVSIFCRNFQNTVIKNNHLKFNKMDESSYIRCDVDNTQEGDGLISTIDIKNNACNNMDIYVVNYNGNSNYSTVDINNNLLSDSILNIQTGSSNITISKNDMLNNTQIVAFDEDTYNHPIENIVIENNRFNTNEITAISFPNSTIYGFDISKNYIYSNTSIELGTAENGRINSNSMRQNGSALDKSLVYLKDGKTVNISDNVVRAIGNTNTINIGIDNSIISRNILSSDIMDTGTGNTKLDNMITNNISTHP